MKRKIGEIFEHDGDWYQCVENKRTWDCVGGYINPTSDMCRCCSIGCFTPEKNYKKLEKVVEPYDIDGKVYQLYKTPLPVNTSPSNKIYSKVRYDIIEIGIK